MKRLSQLVGAVRRALALRAAIGELVLWSTVLGTLALALSIGMPSWPRWPWLALIALAPIAGLLRARRARPSDADVVLWIDRRLEAGEAIVTAWELSARPAVGPVAERAVAPPPLLEGTIAKAERSIASARAKDVRPAIARGDAWGLWMAGATFLVAFQIPVPPPDRGTTGTETVSIADAAVLRRIERLPEQARDPDRRRLDQAADRARQLREDLAQGIERREALDRIEGVRQALEAARPRPSPAQRRAQDAAAEAMQSEQEMASAVGERDLEALDRAVERAAARREARDRERAAQALEDGAREAREAGDEALADSLLERESLLRRRAEQAQLARELAGAMPELSDLGRALESLERDGNGSELNQAMLDAMREAWSRLSPEERQRLADAMRDAPVAPSRASGTAAGAPMSAEQLEAALREALDHLDELQRQAGASGAATGPGAGSGSGAAGSGTGAGSGAGSGTGAGPGSGTGAGAGAGGSGAGSGAGSGSGSGSGSGTGSGSGAGGAGSGGGSGSGSGSGSGAGGTGSGSGSGSGSRSGAGGGSGSGSGTGGGPGREGGHAGSDGSSRDLGAEGGVLARVRPRLGPGAPTQASIEWIDPAGTPLEEGAYCGRATGAGVDGEQGAIERLPIPEDYRDHVREYFEER